MSADLNTHIAARLRGLRDQRGLTIEQLAELSGVSRSMISLIERGQSNATAVVLDKLAAALGVSLASLFDRPRPPGPPVSRRGDQVVWRDPASGYQRRNVSPDGAGSSFHIVEVEFPAGASVAFESGSRAKPIHEQVWVLDGTIEVMVGETRYRLEAGDCLALRLDRPTGFHNPTRSPSRYAVVIAGEET